MSDGKGSICEIFPAGDQAPKYRGVIGADGVLGGVSPTGEGTGRPGLYPSPENFNFLSLNGAFCIYSEAFIRQFTRPVTIMLKPRKTSDIVTKPSNVVTVVQELNLDI